MVGKLIIIGGPLSGTFVRLPDDGHAQQELILSVPHKPVQRASLYLSEVAYAEPIKCDEVTLRLQSQHGRGYYVPKSQTPEETWDILFKNFEVSNG